MFSSTCIQLPCRNMQVRSDSQICRGTGSSSIARCWHVGPQNGSCTVTSTGTTDRLGLA